jgi:hypothetical protein
MSESTSKTAMQVKLLGMLRAEQRVHSIAELREAMLEELEPSDGGPSLAAVRTAVRALQEAGMALHVTYELVAVSRRALLAKTAEVGDAALETPPEGTTGVFREADDGRELRGGAEGCLSGGLAPLTPRAGD